MSDLSRSFKNVSPVTTARKDLEAGDFFHGVWVSDPYRHLEDLDSAETESWTAAQQERFAAFIDGWDREADKDYLMDVWDYPKEGVLHHHGAYYIDSYNPGLAPHKIIRVRDSFDGEPRTLLDPNTMSDDGTVSLSGLVFSKDGTRFAYLTSESGSDAQTMHIRDTATGENLSDVIENCRFTSVTWDKDSTDGFSYSYTSPDDEKRFVLKHHKIGDAPENDPIVFEVDEKGSFVSLSRPRSGTHDWGYVYIGTDPNNGLYVRNTGSNAAFTKVFDSGDSAYTAIGESDGYVYLKTDHDAPLGKLVRFKLDNPEPEHWETIIPEQNDLLEWAFIHKGKLYTSYNHDCSDQAKIFEVDGTPCGEIPLPPQCIAEWGNVDENDDHFFLRISDFKQAGSLYKYDIISNELTMVRPSAAKENLNDCIVERLSVPSKDGTQVPISVIRHPDTKLDGTAAVKLYGYGGFNAPLGPGFSFDIAQWVRKGGIYVQANLRGGGEFGSEWYDQGRLLNKQNVFDDFIACGDFLVDKKYTSTDRLVIEGASNGGLLTAACILQRPDLFGCVISDVPVTDMLRFNQHTHGDAWESDYGVPQENRDDFLAAMGYSPLHNVVEGQHYPPLIVTTADHDDRVVPSHAFKFVATMLEKASSDSLVLMRLEKNAGHGAGKPTEKIIDAMLDTQAAVELTIGPIDQMEYARTLGKKPANDPGAPPQP